jgi:dinuclear metal center YbgI/SA1388 family protein
MAVSLNSAVAVFEKLWPKSLAENWDEVGLVAGSPNQEINSVLLSVDVTAEVVDYAKEIGANLIFAHHPMLLRGVTSIAEDTAKGSVLAELLRSNIAVYSAHTNADSVETGTSAVIAKALGLAKSKPIAPSILPQQGIGQIGNLDKPITLGELASLLNDILPPTATGVRVAGPFDRQVSKIALCAGAGDSYSLLALDQGAEVFITSDLKHHNSQEIMELAKARNVEFALIDISHWAAEFVWLETAMQQLKEQLQDVTFEICDIRTDVFEFLMNKQRDSQ